MIKPEIDIHSQTWMVIQAHAEAELKKLRLMNDGVSNDATQTAFLRGRIDVWKQVLALPAKKAPVVVAGDGGELY